MTIGAVPWVTNYNVPLHTDDMAAAKAVARAVSSKGGGLPGVEVRARCDCWVPQCWTRPQLEQEQEQEQAPCDWMRASPLKKETTANALNVTTPAPAALLRPALA